MTLAVKCDDKIYEGSSRDFGRLYGHLKGKTILDVGCGSGYVSSFLEKQGNRCYGLTVSVQEAALAAKSITDARVLNIESAQELPYEKGFFDAVLFLDVLEHLRDPKKTLELVRPYLKPDAEVIASIPNVANFRIRFDLLWGHFEYRDFGILDRTHLHFFTRESARSLLESSGFSIRREAYTNWNWGFPRWMRTLLSFCEWEIRTRLTQTWPGFFATQFVFYCHQREKAC
jgi:2-polyprenyl-3-methyl-5-hydroxy-6-metoxy-1,4-benzoquinol methylase